ncbi:MAG: GH92 family glycosyl hydrolase [Mobilitalea sp.]
MNYLNYVNIKQGTDSRYRYSNGNTLPLTQLPFGMAGFVPQTNSSTKEWFYHPKDRSIEGIRLTHQPSPWIGEYGAFVLMSQLGQVEIDPAKRWSSYKPEEAVLRPDYMLLKLLRQRAVFELAPAERGGAFRITFEPSDKEKYLSILPVKGECGYWLDSSESMLMGFTKGHGMDDAKNFCMYFVIRFYEGTINLERTLVTDRDGNTVPGHTIEGENTSIHIALDQNKVEAQISISYISIEQAVQNLKQDFKVTEFKDIQEQAEKIWENYLGRIKIEAGEEQLKTFYSCLYRVFLFPHKCYELTADGKTVHYCPGDGAIREGLRYTDIGFWDTYRTSFPLLSIIAKEEYREIMEGFIQDYVDNGWLPRWSSIGEVGCMPSTMIDAVIADGAVKGILPRSLLEIGFLGMQKHANVPALDQRYGRNGVKAYLNFGYIPYNIEKESVNLTLDAAYGDYCIAQVARILEQYEVEEEYLLRAGNYRNLYDSSTGFMRGKDDKGEFRTEFNPLEWGYEYTEGGAWQSSFAVQHDLEGLAELHGGVEKFLEKLDELFTTPPDFLIGSYEQEIHEMSEMAAVDFGQCAISNQPSFHLPFLYAAFDRPEKTDDWVERICRELFSWQDNGYPGDEDNGSMSAWYIFATLGLYPLCPGKPEYIKSKMLVKSALIDGKRWDNTGFEKKILHSDI